MLFTDSFFLFYFLPAVLAIHYFTTRLNPKPTYSNLSRLVLFGSTLAFYGYQEPWWLLPFFVSITFDFLWAYLLAKVDHPGLRKGFLIASVIQNLALLALFKYWDFITANLAALAPNTFATVPRLTLNHVPLALPAGISFYTFESLSFVIDVYRREVKPPKNPLEFFAFIGMFPRFIAGPIVRYKDMQSQFQHYAGMDLEKGLALFIGGFFLKTCFADHFAVFLPYAFRPTPEAVGFVAAWVGVLAYTMQIYFDFAGYSLMAIGLGKCLGFDFPENFRTPYHAQSLSDFWRRWHISLSSWLRDYVYKAMGGSRHGTTRTYVNLLLTMVIGGVWHGASWNFVVWGGWHGLVLAIERALIKTTNGPSWFGRAYTFLAVMIGWVFFKASDLAQARSILTSMFNPWHGPTPFNPEGLKTHLLSLCFCAFGLVYGLHLEPRFTFTFKTLEQFNGWQKAGLVALFICALVTVFSSATVPFLYFQF